MVENQAGEAAADQPSPRLSAKERRKARRAAARAAQPPKVVPDHLSQAVTLRAPTGQIVGRRALTAKEERFADLLASGVRPGLAGELAGFADPRASASRASARPAVRARVLQLQRGKIQRLSVIATSRLADILTGKVPAPTATLLDAIKYAHKAAGLDAPDDKAKETKDLRTMSTAELEALAAAFREKAAASTAPQRPGDDAQVIDVTAESVT